MAQGGGIAQLALKQRVAHESLYEWVGHKMTTSRVLSGTDAQNTSLDIVLLSEDRPEVQVGEPLGGRRARGQHQAQDDHGDHEAHRRLAFPV